MTDYGKFIVAMGIPCCGKSSVIKRLAELYEVKAFCEPEESEWPDAVNEREAYGYFTGISWFRSVRVPYLYQAQKLALDGKIAFVDSYYDKLIYKYLDKPGMEWLVPKNDIYYDLTQELAKTDYDVLPNADIVIFFEIEESLWQSFLKKRNRSLDQNSSFLKKCFLSQKHMKDACKQYADEFGKKLLIIKQEDSSAETMAAKIKDKLEELL
ncbi:MAG: hypothetical protein FWE04_05755 [Oscillospiraceae bacterium]|nr:hypothetical protein [Oscillospiraceae bacterium]